MLTNDALFIRIKQFASSANKMRAGKGRECFGEIHNFGYALAMKNPRKTTDTDR